MLTAVGVSSIIRDSDEKDAEKSPMKTRLDYPPLQFLWEP